MAVDFKKLKDELVKAPLSQMELDLIKDAETYIDKQIIENFKGDSVYIILSCPRFDYNHIKKEMIDKPFCRKELLRKELENRYRKAGWKFEVRLDDGLDGPNMGGADYWILSGK